MVFESSNRVDDLYASCGSNDLLAIPFRFCQFVLGLTVCRHSALCIDPNTLIAFCHYPRKIKSQTIIHHKATKIKSISKSSDIKQLSNTKKKNNSFFYYRSASATKFISFFILRYHRKRLIFSNSVFMFSITKSACKINNFMNYFPYFVNTLSMSNLSKLIHHIVI